MKKPSIKRNLSVIAAAFAVALVLPVAVTAQNARAHEGEGAHSEEASEHREAAQAGAEERREAAQTRLADAKLLACENRQEAITNIMTRLADRGQKQVDLFSTIADRVQQFYANKGRTIENYDALVADVGVKKIAAQVAVDAVKATGSEFDCAGQDPKGVASTFKESLKTEIEALKAYKTAVKNLIVGVKSAQGQAASGDQGGEE